MGRPLPGYDIVLLDTNGHPADEGEVSIRLDPRPVGLMEGYAGVGAPTTTESDGFYRTGDVARRDADGYFWYIGRADDVFKSSDWSRWRSNILPLPRRRWFRVRMRCVSRYRSAS
jgi:acetyl-CoA synthetase